MKKPKVKFPKGWNDKQVKALVSHFDNQSEDDAAAEDEAAYRSTHMTMMAVPVELVPKVQKLIARRPG